MHYQNKEELPFDTVWLGPNDIINNDMQSKNDWRWVGTAQLLAKYQTLTIFRCYEKAYENATGATFYVTTYINR